MLEFEAALASAEAQAGMTPAEAADAIAAACEPERYDAEALGRAARATGNPAAPLVHALTEAVEGDAVRFVHGGATSQDVMDTASMLVARRVLALIGRELDGVAGACARLADEHRNTTMPGRTLLQQALPTTFGLKAAGWLVAALDARAPAAVGAARSGARRRGGHARLAGRRWTRRVAAAGRPTRARGARPAVAHRALASGRDRHRSGAHGRKPGEGRP